MNPTPLLGILLILGFIATCFSRPLKEKEMENIKLQQPKWKSPPIDEFLEGNVSKKGPVYTYQFKYKNNEENKICDVTFKQQIKDGLVESQHKWNCKKDVPKDSESEEAGGEDYTRFR